MYEIFGPPTFWLGLTNVLLGVDCAVFLLVVIGAVVVDVIETHRHSGHGALTKDSVGHKAAPRLAHGPARVAFK